jgi:hypothetical protein
MWEPIEPLRTRDEQLLAYKVGGSEKSKVVRLNIIEFSEPHLSLWQVSLYEYSYIFRSRRDTAKINDEPPSL